MLCQGIFSNGGKISTIRPFPHGQALDECGKEGHLLTGRETQEYHTGQHYGIPVWKKKSWGAEACINLTCCYSLSSKFKHETRKTVQSEDLTNNLNVCESFE